MTSPAPCHRFQLPQVNILLLLNRCINDILFSGSFLPYFHPGSSHTHTHSGIFERQNPSHSFPFPSLDSAPFSGISKRDFSLTSWLMSHLDIFHHWPRSWRHIFPQSVQHSCTIRNYDAFRKLHWNCKVCMRAAQVRTVTNVAIVLCSLDIF